MWSKYKLIARYTKKMLVTKLERIRNAKFKVKIYNGWNIHITIWSRIQNHCIAFIFYSFSNNQYVRNNLVNWINAVNELKLSFQTDSMVYGLWYKWVYIVMVEVNAVFLNSVILIHIPFILLSAPQIKSLRFGMLTYSVSHVNTRSKYDLIWLKN